MAFLDDFRAQVEAAKPKCKRCGAVSIAKITYSQNYSGRDIWSEEHTCLDHANDLFERIKRGAILLETKWLNK
ncbi:hypothetical protein [Rhodococcus sp. KRD197]|uniref:hypothetical protein n=1 Tax=Rhodococcus sp. KRD197 TaxID=2729731 RepID=UPI0019CF505B|nr:hypothetical protein [Rhodococcus sp. KRD197]